MNIITSLTDPRVATHYRILDVRNIPNAEKSLRVIQAFETLNRGGAFILLADSDPQDMCEHVRSEIQERCELTVLEQAENAWRVLIKRLS